MEDLASGFCFYPVFRALPDFVAVCHRHTIVDLALRKPTVKLLVQLFTSWRSALEPSIQDPPNLGQYVFVGILGAWVSAEYNVAALPQLISDAALYGRHPIPSWNVCIEVCLLRKNWAYGDHLKSTIQAIDTRLL
jgi:hypothetical protein